MIGKFHYITQGNIEDKSHVELAELACKGGVKWVQLRMKTGPEAEKLKIAQAVRAVCTKYGATFIMNDHVALAKEVNADGIHLGKEDMSIPAAREILGEDKIYGGTANNLEDVKKLLAWQVDYIGLGPLRFTKTKDKLSPIMGVIGYKTIIETLNDSQNNTPIIAIGGVLKEDFPELYKVGVYGVALASPINLSQNPTKEAQQFLDAVNQSFNS